jgi:hypothetical protein
MLEPEQVGDDAFGGVLLLYSCVGGGSLFCLWIDSNIGLSPELFGLFNALSPLFGNEVVIVIESSATSFQKDGSSGCNRILLFLGPWLDHILLSLREVISNLWMSTRNNSSSY